MQFMARIVGQKSAPGRRRAQPNNSSAQNVKYSIGNNRWRAKNTSHHPPVVAALQLQRNSPLTTSSVFPASGIIEAASSQLGSSHTRFAQKPGTGHANRADDRHERAMARRLQQLQAALGNNENIAPMPETAQPVAASRSRNAVGTGALALSCVLSALLGAGAMWLATDSDLGAKATAPITVAAAVSSTAPQAPQMAPAVPAEPEVSDTTRINDLLEAWRNAWSQRDIAGYLNAYSQQFSPADGSSRDAWVAARTKKLAAGAPIDIQIKRLSIERIDADQFKASFLQDYASGSYRETARTKTLLIVREGNAWKIRQERAE